MAIINKKSSVALFAVLALSLAGFGWQDEKPLFTDYRGVTIGMTADEARTKLGKAENESDTEDQYQFSDGESARVWYDEGKKVKAVSVTFSAKSPSAPTPQKVLGTSVEPRPDGGMYKMIQYPKHGYWVSFVKTAGDDPLVIVTIQQMIVVE